MSSLQPELGKTVIEFSCGCCGGRLTVPVAYAGMEGPCPECGEVVASPRVEPALPEGVGEFVPLNRSNLRGDEVAGEETRDPGVERKRSGVPERRRRREFVAKQRIEAGWERDDSWREHYREGAKRWSRRQRMQRRIGRLFDSSRMYSALEVFAPAAVFIAVGTVIFMKLDGWGLRGGDAGAEAKGSAVAEVATAVGAGGGGVEEEGVEEMSNLAAFERVRAAAEDDAEGAEN